MYIEGHASNNSEAALANFLLALILTARKSPRTEVTKFRAALNANSKWLMQSVASRWVGLSVPVGIRMVSY